MLVPLPAMLLCAVRWCSAVLVPQLATSVPEPGSKHERRPAFAGDPAQMSHLPATSGPQHTPDRLIRDAIIPCNFSERFALFNAMKNGRPFSNRYFPMGVWPWVMLPMQ